MKILLTNILLSALILSSYAQEATAWKILNEGEGHFDLIGFVNNNIGLLSKRNAILKTKDGGSTWNTIFVEENGLIGKVDFIDEFTGWAVFYGQ